LLVDSGREEYEKEEKKDLSHLHRKPKNNLQGSFISAEKKKYIIL